MYSSELCVLCKFVMWHKSEGRPQKKYNMEIRKFDNFQKQHGCNKLGRKMKPRIAFVVGSIISFAVEHKNLCFLSIFTHRKNVTKRLELLK